MKKAIVFILIMSLFMQLGITSIAYADENTAVFVAATGETKIDFLNYTSGYRANNGGNALETGPGISICIRKNDYVLYDIDVETAGNYKLTIATAYPGATPSKPISVSSGDKLLGACDIANTGSWGVSGEVLADEIYLEEGLQTLKFTNTTDAYFYYFILERNEASGIHNVASIGKTRIEFKKYTSGYHGSSGGNTLEMLGDSVCIRKTDYVLFDINVETAGNYKLTIATAYPGATPSKPISVSSGDKLLGKCDIANTGSWGIAGEVKADEIYLEEGLQTLKFTNTTDAYFHYFILERNEVVIYDVDSTGETKVEFENYSEGFNASGADTEVLDVYSNEALSGGNSVSLTNAGDWASFRFKFHKAAVYNIKVGVSCTENVIGEDISIKKSSEIIAKADLVNTGDINTVAVCDLGDFYFEDGVIDLVIETQTDALFDYIIIEYVRETLKIEAENFSSFSGVENYGAVLSFNTNNWVDYAISVEKDGFYSVDMYSGLDPSYAYDFCAVSVYFDGNLVLTGNINKTTAWTDYRQFNMGSAYMEAGDHVIRFHVTSGANWFDRFVIDYGGNSLNLKNVLVNEKKVSENGFVFRGTDYFELEFTQNIDKRYIVNENIYITDGEKNIAADLLQDGKKIGVVLKETLDFDKEYTICIQDVKDASGRLSLDNESFVFNTYGEENDSGEAFLGDIKANIKYEDIIVEGRIYSGKSSPISGRKVLLYVGEGSTALAFATSNKDGSFSIFYTLPEGTEEGNVNIHIDGEYVSEKVLRSLTYVSQDTEKAIIEELKATTSAEVIGETFVKYESELGISVSEDTKMLDDVNKVFASVVKTDISSYTYEEIIDLYYTYIAVEAINQAETQEEIKAVLENSSMCEKLCINVNKLQSLAEDMQSEFVNGILELDEISDADSLISSITRILDGSIAEQHGKNGKTLLGDVEISSYIGKGLDFPISFTEKFSGAKRIVFEIKGGDNTILEGAEIIKKTYGDIETNVDGDVLTVIYTPKSSDFAVYDVAVLRVTLRNVVGERYISISGYVEYDAGLDYLIKEPIADKNIKITVSENTSKPSRDESYISGGGSSTGGRPSGGGSSGNSDVIIPPATDDNNTDKLPFDDLAEVKWAEESIINLVGLDIISESEDRKFNPQNNTKREEIVKMLVEAFGVFDKEAEVDFTDVPKNVWFYQYVASAKKAGLVTGNDKGKFMSGSYLTREDVATMVWRALAKKGYKAAEDYELFTDDENISQYAKKAVYSMRELGIINGMGDNTFAPKSCVTRAQAAKIIYETVRMVTK